MRGVDSHRLPDRLAELHRAELMYDGAIPADLRAHILRGGRSRLAKLPIVRGRVYGAGYRGSGRHSNSNGSSATRKWGNAMSFLQNAFQLPLVGPDRQFPVDPAMIDRMGELMRALAPRSSGIDNRIAPSSLGASGGIARSTTLGALSGGSFGPPLSSIPSTLISQHPERLGLALRAAWNPDLQSADAVVSPMSDIAGAGTSHAISAARSISDTNSSAEPGEDSADPKWAFGIVPDPPQITVDECIDRCYQLLERPLPHPGSDKNTYDFHRCVNRCMGKE